MAETKKFVDLTGLDYFWDGAKKYIDAADAKVKSDAEKLDTAMGVRVAALEGAKDDYKTADASLKTELLGKIADNAAADATAKTELNAAIKANTDAIEVIQDELNSLSGGAGSIATQIDNAIAKLDVEDTAVAGEYVSSVSEVDGKIAVTRVALPDYTEDFAAKANASDLTTHTGDTTVHITAAERTAWNAAEQNAKDYADSKFQVAGDYETAGEAAKVQSNLDSHDADAVKHITADERTAWNSAKASIDAFLKDADMSEKAVDTLAELQTYMNGDGEAAAELVGRVAALEAIDHEAYKAADTTLETSLKAYADQAEADALAAAKADAANLYQVKGSYEAAGAAAQALVDAKTYADGLAANYDAAGAAAQALADAKADAESKYQVKGNYETAGAAAQALVDAKAYTDDKVDGKFDTVGSAAGALTDAKKYTDEAFNGIVAATNNEIDAIFA